MELVLNGTARQYDAPQSVASLLADMGLSTQRVAVEVNREVIPRSQHAGHLLADGDRVEIIQAIGGG